MTINRTLRKLDIKYCKRAPRLDDPDHQLQRIKTLARNEISKRTQKTLVMDDESCFTFSGCKLHSNVVFDSSNVEQSRRESKEYPTVKMKSNIML